MLVSAVSSGIDPITDAAHVPLSGSREGRALPFAYLGVIANTQSLSPGQKDEKVP